MAWLNAPQTEEEALPAYQAIVAQARKPVFYEGLGVPGLGVPDTPQGRFEMVMLHAALVISRLKDDKTYTQAMFDLMFGDFDMNLRELGVGDLGIGKRVRSWAEAFKGRALAYEAGLNGEAPLATALVRNINASEEAAQIIAAYMLAAHTALQATPEGEIKAGQIAWPPLKGI